MLPPSILRSSLFALRSSVRYLALIGGSAALLTLSGCATYCCNGLPQPSTLVAAPNKITAVGYGTPTVYAQYTPGQQKLMAIRAAQVNAYKNLAEQVYGFRISGSTVVSAFATQSDVARSYVDAFIRGARVVSTSAIADGNYEVTVELDITPNFLGCFSNDGSCFPHRGYNSTPGCVTYGCTAPSMTYYSY